MTTAPLPGFEVCYEGRDGVVDWEGRVVAGAGQFAGFMRDVVRPRLDDEVGGFEADLRALKSTGMGTDYIGRLLAAVPAPEPWQIGEAFAECALQCDDAREVVWPWNMVRDKRTPRASLPGADLVGLCVEGDDVWLLFGEVKTSSDAATPPNVMTGRGGMNAQLEQTATDEGIQYSLLAWLHARCAKGAHALPFQKAMSRFLRSAGKEVVLVGVLLRDTEPNEKDLCGRAVALASRLSAATRAELLAWYLPTSIAEWPTLIAEVGA